MSSGLLGYYSPHLQMKKQKLKLNSKKTVQLKNWLKNLRASLVAQLVKNLPAMQETWFQSLGLEDPLKGMATKSNILAWRIPWTEEPGEL